MKLRKFHPHVIFIFIFPAIFAESAGAQQFSAFLSFPREKMKPSFTVSYGNYFSTDLKDQSGKISENNIESSLVMPVYQSDHSVVIIQMKASQLNIQTDAIFPDSNIPLPDQFWDVSLGVGYKYLFPNRRILGGTLSLESASDQPYKSADDTAIHFLGSYLVPQEGMNSWLFLLDFNNHRTFWSSIPLPGVGYFWMPSQKFTALLGFPVMFARYSPEKRISLSLSYFPLQNVSARFQYQVIGPFSFFTGYNISEEAYFRSDREDTDEQLHIFNQDFSSGIQGPITQNLYCIISGSYSFNRFIFEGKHFSDRDTDRINLKNGFSVSIKLSAKF